MFLVIRAFRSDSAESNSYLVFGDRCCVIDPGISASSVLKHKGDYNIRIDVLINTHCHFDHVGANASILGNGGVEAYAGVYDADALSSGDDSLQLASLFGKRPVKHNVDKVLLDGDAIDLGGLTLEVLHTPGHTKGSICLYEPVSRTMFTGDSVFADAVGRTDLKSGSPVELEASVRRLAEFHDKKGISRIYPGHGPPERGGAIRNIMEEFFGT